jgi:hypothetical protein
MNGRLQDQESAHPTQQMLLLSAGWGLSARVSSNYVARAKATGEQGGTFNRKPPFATRLLVHHFFPTAHSASYVRK